MPPNFNPDNKVYISLWESGSIIGVLDLLAGYPHCHCLWLGLLLIHGKLHGKRHGSRIVTALLTAAKTAGYTSTQLGVIETNEPGLSFWHSHGFQKLRTSGNIIILEKQLT